MQHLGKNNKQCVRKGEFEKIHWVGSMKNFNIFRTDHSQEIIGRNQIAILVIGTERHQKGGGDGGGREVIEQNHEDEVRFTFAWKFHIYKSADIEWTVEEMVLGKIGHPFRKT